MQKFKYFTMHKYLLVNWQYLYNIMKMNVVHVHTDTKTLIIAQRNYTPLTTATSEVGTH